MSLFTLLISVHLVSVALTIGFFIARYWWRYSNNPLINARWVRIAPHCIDTVLFLSGAGLMWKTGYLPFTDKGAWLTEKLFGVIIYTQNNSSCMKAARERVLRSIVNYVTEVSERSQRACSLKYDGYISFWVLSRLDVVVRAASRSGLSPFCWVWWCCTSSLNSPPLEYRYWGKS